ncbi:hypothetical protein [Maribellus sediminis]|uniref:hypothetical protein n=1 Tax=Maribellus sediminis TaxID=2696285 RepID=UPI0014320C1C|nr:hypothetical protein [Maribellus sediminis]
MKKLQLTILVVAMSINVVMSQNTTQTAASSKENKKEDVQFKHSIGSSLFMLYNFTDESADYVLLTYGYQLSSKDRIFAEYNTWKYAEPMGTYGDSDESYPGYVRTHGIGIGYKRFIWKGLFATAEATNFYKQYFGENDNKIQTGYQLYLQTGIGYRFEFFKKRFYVEPAWLIKFWPVDTNIPADFAAIEEGTPKHIWEPSLNFGFKF